MCRAFGQIIGRFVNPAVKIRPLCLLFPLLLLAASPAPAQTNAPKVNSSLLPNLANLTNQASQVIPTNRPHVVLPFQVVVIETAEASELKALTNQARTFLTTKDYDGLDDFLDKLRSSKKSWATGRWKLSDAYSGLIPADDASDAEWIGRLAALRHWIAAKPESISARVALADFLTAFAWKARGSGWANTVTEEGWQLFRQRLDESMNVLNEAAHLKAKCPELWVVKMRSALGLQYEKPQFNDIFDEAIRFAPDYEAYYYRRAIYLLPRWSGEPGEWENDLAQSADRLGGKDGDELYARVVWSIHKYGSADVFKENNLSWARVDRGFEGIVESFPNSVAANSERANLAVLARDRRKARRYFDQTHGLVDLSVWASRDHFVRYANWVYWQP